MYLGPQEYADIGSARVIYRLSDANDSSGNGLHLSALGSVSYPVDHFSNVADLGTGGSNALVRTNHIFTAAQLANITISFWVKLNAEITTGFYRFLEFHTDKVTPANGMALLIQYEYNAGTPRLFFTHYLSTTPVEIYYPITLGTTSWYNIVYTKIATIAGVGYVNGQAVGLAIGSGSDNGGDSGYTYDIAIGTSRSGTGSWVEGRLDDFLVWEEVRTAQQIADIYLGPETTQTYGFSNAQTAIRKARKAVAY